MADREAGSPLPPESAAAGEPPVQAHDDAGRAGLWRDTRYLSFAASRAQVVVPMALGAAVVASLAFEYGYFATLGVSLRLIPVKLLDIGFSATAWLGSLVYALVIAAIIEGVVVWWTRGRTLTETVFDADDPRRWRKRFLLPGWICTGLGTVTLLVWLAIGGRFGELVGAIQLLFLGLMVLAVDRLRLRGERGLGIWRASVTFGILVLLFAWLGSDAAADDVARARAERAVLRQGTDAATPIVRALTDGAIAVRDGRLLYMPFAAGFEIDLGPLSLYRPGLLCMSTVDFATTLCDAQRARVG